jgi:hypothetical protein
MEAHFSDDLTKHNRQFKSMNSTILIDRNNDTGDLHLFTNKFKQKFPYPKSIEPNDYFRSDSKKITHLSLRGIKDNFNCTKSKYNTNYISKSNSNILNREVTNQIPKINMKNHFKDYFENRPIVELKSKVYTYSTEEMEFDLKMRQFRLKNSVNSIHNSCSERMFKLMKGIDIKRKNLINNKLKNIKEKTSSEKDPEQNNKNEQENINILKLEMTHSNEQNKNRKKRGNIRAFQTDLPSNIEDINSNVLEKFLKRKEKLEFLIPEFRDDFINEDEVENEKKYLVSKKSDSSDESIEINKDEIDRFTKRIKQNKKESSVQKNKLPLNFNLNYQRKQFVLKDFNQNLHPAFNKAHQSKNKLKSDNFKSDLMGNTFFKNIFEVARTSHIFKNHKKINSSDLIPKKRIKEQIKNSDSHDFINNLNKIGEKRDKLLNEMINSRKSI